jgi:hypothetical protein
MGGGNFPLTSHSFFPNDISQGYPLKALNRIYDLGLESDILRISDYSGIPMKRDIKNGPQGISSISHDSRP